jgi:hypothetical protein
MGSPLFADTHFPMAENNLGPAGRPLVFNHFYENLKASQNSEQTERVLLKTLHSEKWSDLLNRLKGRQIRALSSEVALTILQSLFKEHGSFNEEKINLLWESNSFHRPYWLINISRSVGITAGSGLSTLFLMQLLGADVMAKYFLGMTVTAFAGTSFIWFKDPSEKFQSDVLDETGINLKYDTKSNYALIRNLIHACTNARQSSELNKK